MGTGSTGTPFLLQVKTTGIEESTQNLFVNNMANQIFNYTLPVLTAAHKHFENVIKLTTVTGLCDSKNKKKGSQ